jgi:hypothetical protein
MHIEIGRDIGFDLSKKFAELRGAVFWKAFSDHGARCDIKRGE